MVTLAPTGAASTSMRSWSMRVMPPPYPMASRRQKPRRVSARNVPMTQASAAAGCLCTQTPGPRDSASTPLATPRPSDAASYCVRLPDWHHWSGRDVPVRARSALHDAQHLLAQHVDDLDRDRCPALRCREDERILNEVRVRRSSVDTSPVRFRRSTTRRASASPEWGSSAPPRMRQNSAPPVSRTTQV